MPGGAVFSIAKHQPKISTKGNYGLTPLGKVKAEDGSIPGNRGKVLAAVEAGGYSSPREIAQEAGLPDDQTKQILLRLMKLGYIQKEYEES